MTPSSCSASSSIASSAARLSSGVAFFFFLEPMPSTRVHALALPQQHKRGSAKPWHAIRHYRGYSTCDLLHQGGGLPQCHAECALAGRCPCQPARSTYDHRPSLLSHSAMPSHNLAENMSSTSLQIFLGSVEFSNLSHGATADRVEGARNVSSTRKPRSSKHYQIHVCASVPAASTAVSRLSAACHQIWLCHTRCNNLSESFVSQVILQLLHVGLHVIHFASDDIFISCTKARGPRLQRTDGGPASAVADSPAPRSSVCDVTSCFGSKDSGIMSIPVFVHVLSSMQSAQAPYQTAQIVRCSAMPWETLLNFDSTITCSRTLYAVVRTHPRYTPCVILSWQRAT